MTSVSTSDLIPHISGGRVPSGKAALVAAFFLATTLVWSGCASDDASIDQDPRPVAWVNDDLVTVSEFEQTYINFLVLSGGNDTLENRRIHLENLIDGFLLAEVFDREGLDSLFEYQRLKKRDYRAVLAERYFDEAFLFTLPAPTEEDLRRTFSLSKQQVAVRHLFFMSEEQAEQSWERLESGTSFIDEAQRVYDTASFDSTAGLLGPVKYFSVDDAFAETAFSLEVGAYSEPIRSRYGFHIIKAEDRIFQPILTESEYQVKRDGISSQFRLRTRRLEGDRFVRSFMEGLDVQAQQEAIEALQFLLQEALRDNDSPVPIGQEESEGFRLQQLLDDLDPSSVLATYLWDGEREAFTVEEYLFWLEALPFWEARDRTAASVGRAMRNELLARKGEEERYDDAKAREQHRRQMRLAKSRVMRGVLRSDTSSAIPAELFDRALESKGLADRTMQRATYDLIQLDNQGQADRIAERIRDGEVAFRDIPGYRKVSDQLLTGEEPLHHHIRKAPDGEVVVIGLQDSWVVARVDERSKVDVDQTDEAAALVAEFGPLVREYELLREERRDADIRVDSVLFEQLYSLELFRREIQ